MDADVIHRLRIVGAGLRDAECPNCGSWDRERLVYVFLAEKMRVFGRSRALRVLHVAPEANLAKAFRDAGCAEYVCGDLLAANYNYGAYVEKLDLRDIGFSENHFDLVVANHVLEHIPEDRKAMAEIWRVLRPGGTAILQVPIAQELMVTYENADACSAAERIAHFGQSDHCRIYGQDYPDKLAEAGFSVSRVNISREFPKYGLNPCEDIFVCAKP